MKVQHQQLIIGLLKAGQTVVDSQQPKKYHRKEILLRGAYPDYSRSLVARRKQSPEEAGASRAMGTGITGAVLGALIARIISDKPKHILAGTGIGAAAGAIPGYISGRDEALSDYSKMLLLRRLGVKSLGNLGSTIDESQFNTEDTNGDTDIPTTPITPVNINIGQPNA